MLIIKKKVLQVIISTSMDMWVYFSNNWTKFEHGRKCFGQACKHWTLIETVDKVLLLSAVAYFFCEIWFHFHWRLHRLIANTFLPSANFKGTWQQLSITIKHCGMKIVCRLFQSFKRPHTTQTCDCVKWWLDLF